ncbi:M50 family metallopeptidase [Arthrobacter sp. SX1312]|uniref:M50 family metallopeptidase n=1 Tax=Arthrobacter sp. SX1312 TaxID=2058896 RepID=UPI0021574117|nr:M50 family metallopeptidase [Arthrobacter sp. SX1312]
METLPGQLWERITDGFLRVAPPAIGAVGLVAIVLVAVALSVPRRSWRVFGLFVTVVHELGHATAALLTLQRVTGITLRLDHSGTTTSLGRRGWRAAFTTFWGYPVPAVVGSLLLWGAAHGWAPAALSISAVVLVAALALIRNGQGVLILGGSAAVSLGLVWFGGAAAAGYACLVLGVALLVGACRDWVKVVRVHRRRRDLVSSDAHLLRVAIRIPSPVWLGMFALVIGAAVALSFTPLALIAGASS